jgi:CRISPR-associated protein Csd2
MTPSTSTRSRTTRSRKIGVEIEPPPKPQSDEKKMYITTIPEALRDPSRYMDFCIHIEAPYARLQGDPHAQNIPRQCHITGKGLCTHNGVHRRVRDILTVVHGKKVYILGDKPLNDKHIEAFKSIDLMEGGSEAKGGQALGALFWDVPLFGGMANTGKKEKDTKGKKGTDYSKYKCGVHVGPIALQMGRTTHPVHVVDIGITRQAATTAKERNDKSGDKKDLKTMATNSVVVYGLYRFEGRFVPSRAARFEAFSSEHLRLYWDALVNHLDTFLSTPTRGSFTTRRLDVFVHESSEGNARPQNLLSRIKPVCLLEGQGPTCPEDMTFVEEALDDLPREVQHFQLV